MQADAVLAGPAPTRLPVWRQFRLIFRIQFTDYQDQAVLLVLFSLLMPLGMLWLLGDTLAGKGEGAAWMQAGNVVMAVGFGSGSFSVWRIGQLRLNREMDYYAMLPISKLAFLGALFSLVQISVLPGLLSSLFVGRHLLAISLERAVAAIPVALLAGACLTVVGTALGSLARSQGHLQLYANLIFIVVLFLSPVMLPLERLPLLMKGTSYLFPPGQAAMALTDALTGQFGLRFWGMTSALVAWLGLALVYTTRRLDWRND
ncbi:MAG TPA: ABC transporter permease [Symbiobacteriaceae bacterium]|nr:ABC transporter permease [Symbiobacteriaceae bacterium]